MWNLAQVIIYGSKYCPCMVHLQSKTSNLE
jgi:hypothetical protein